jgi:hypothetical protein
MSSLRSRILIGLVITSFCLGSCETDIAVIAPKRDVTIIYGLLEANQFRHYIRINKAFVGEEAAAEMAMQNGINEYSDSEMAAQIIELEADELTPTGKTWPLIATKIYSKEEGDFNNDSNKVYYFDANLDVDKTYKIECLVNIEGEEPKTVTAVTNLLGNKSADGGIEQIRLNKPRLSGNSSTNGGSDRTNDEVAFVNNTDFAPGFEVAWTATDGGALYTSYFRLYYRDYDLNTNTVSLDSVTLSVGSKNFEGKQGQVTFPGVNTKDYYSSLGRRVEDLDTAVVRNIKRVVSDTLQFFLEIGNKELTTYIEVNQPTTGVVQERPEYTNVENGIGIFASRLVVSTRSNSIYETGRILDNRSCEELLYSNLPRIPDPISGNVDPMYTASKSFTIPGRCLVDPATGPRCQ